MTPTAKTTTTQASPVSLHERCQYTNKQCPNRRMTKRNGQLHRLCVEHRDKANTNHRRWLESRVQQARTTARRLANASPQPSNPLPDVAITNAMLWEDDPPSVFKLGEIFLDEDELNDFVSEFLLTPEELRALHEDVIKECRFLTE